MQHFAKFASQNAQVQGTVRRFVDLALGQRDRARTDATRRSKQRAVSLGFQAERLVRSACELAEGAHSAYQSVRTFWQDDVQAALDANPHLARDLEQALELLDEAASLLRKFPAMAAKVGAVDGR